MTGDQIEMADVKALGWAILEVLLKERPGVMLGGLAIAIAYLHEKRELNLGDLRDCTATLIEHPEGAEKEE